MMRAQEIQWRPRRLFKSLPRKISMKHKKKKLEMEQLEIIMELEHNKSLKMKRTFEITIGFSSNSRLMIELNRRIYSLNRI